MVVLDLFVTIGPVLLFGLVTFLTILYQMDWSSLFLDWDGLFKNEIIK